MKKAKKAKPKLNGRPRASSEQDAQIGARIRAIRMDRNLSQAVLGDALGVSFQQVQKYERGVNRISAVRLNQIANLLKTTSDELGGFDKTKVQVDGAIAFDAESYKLAREFSKLPGPLKAQFRSLISSIIKNTA